MTELEQEAIKFMKKQPKDPEGHLVYEVMAKFAEFKLKVWQFEHQSWAGAQPTPKIEDMKYLKLLRWFKFFYKFYQDGVKDKPSACASALSEDGELQEFIREANRIG